MMYCNLYTPKPGQQRIRTARVAQAGTGVRMAGDSKPGGGGGEPRQCLSARSMALI